MLRWTQRPAWAGKRSPQKTRKRTAATAASWFFRTEPASSTAPTSSALTACCDSRRARSKSSCSSPVRGSAPLPAAASSLRSSTIFASSPSRSSELFSTAASRSSLDRAERRRRRPCRRTRTQSATATMITATRNHLSSSKTESRIKEMAAVAASMRNIDAIPCQASRR